MAASKQMLLAAVAAAIAAFVFLPALASATDYVVGDSVGWTLGFNYTAWAETKQFTVGDTLVFEYSSSSHNVAEVSGADFRACNKGAATAVWSSGDDRVALDEPGRRWFVCAVGTHCQHGMKLVVNVLPGTPSPVPAPEPGVLPVTLSPVPAPEPGVLPVTLSPVPAPEPGPADMLRSRRFLSRWW